MLKLQVRRWSERPRTLVLMLAVILPAASLIVFGLYHLRSIQQDKAIEAAIQRDYQQVLAIAEKQIDMRAYEVAEEASAKFPDTDSSGQIDAFLKTHPDIAHAFLWSGKGNFMFRSQPGRMRDSREFCAESQMLSSDFEDWWDLEGKDEIARLKKVEANTGRHVLFMEHPITRGEKMQYQSLVLFVPRGSNVEHPVLGGFIYDTDYLKNHFFPQALNAVLPDQMDNMSHPQKGFMVRYEKDEWPLATSMYWDGGAPEVERPFESVFSGLILGIKLRGTTIASISAHFLRTSFLVLGALSFLMGAGLILTYRNVARELALAKLKSDFVSNVSHELRTPLALIRLYAETLELGRISSTGKQQEYYEIIRKESERLTSLINNILDFSRIESGKKEYSFRETNVADLVRTTLESYRFEIEQNGFEFDQKIDSDVPPLWVDREAIARSLLNLVNNAVKYSSNEKYLGVRLYRHSNGVNLEVVDHGIGIPAKEHLKIFEKFYRVGDPLVHNTKGSGLGLSLVRHIVKAHGGEVAVESAPGKGSRFIITLPLQTSAAQ